MQVNIKGQVYYRTKEACQKSGISRSTFYRWLSEGIVEDVGQRDRNGWRLFSEKDVAAIRAEAIRTNQE